MTVYLVVHDEDPGYQTLKIVGVYSTRERAEQRMAAAGVAYDMEIIELTVDDASER